MVRKLDSNSLTKTKNWSGRYEVTETSGRLRPLWPQNKWLHTPRTTDYRYTRQDRWIQTELAFTLARNATKPNPFEIIPLQTTRKENNWKTEEALARATVTLETERIKASSPWYLWWWLLKYTIISLLHVSVFSDHRQGALYVPNLSYIYVKTLAKIISLYILGDVAAYRTAACVLCALHTTHMHSAFVGVWTTQISKCTVQR